MRYITSKSTVCNFSCTLEFNKCATYKTFVYNTNNNPAKAFYVKLYSSRVK